jgi:16S rRNA (guanine(966)-N(2))-methyltransferase RsmD
VRIISGIYRGRRLNPLRLKDTRPTTDYAREGLFNILTSKLDFTDLRVLDLYSGTGAMAIEFLSRGSKSATAVDLGRESVKFVADIKQQWGIENLTVVKANAIRYLEKCPLSFDIIFADPPYNSEDGFSVLKAVQSGKLLAEDGILIIEHEKHKDFSTEPWFQNKRSFGKVNFSFFQAS